MTDYLNPNRIYPDCPSRRIDNPPGNDSIRKGSEEKGGRMSEVYDFNGIKLWFADGYPSTREEAEDYFKHAQTKKLDLTAVVVVRDGEWADIKYTVRAKPFERIRRITGYLQKTGQWNSAKKAELQDRVVHEKGDC